MVQNLPTSFADAVAAIGRVLKREDGPTLLVSHSCDSSVITEACIDPKVGRLVYVAAFAPAVSQSTLNQYTEIPPPPDFVPKEQPNSLSMWM